MPIWSVSEAQQKAEQAAERDAAAARPIRDPPPPLTATEEIRRGMARDDARTRELDARHRVRGLWGEVQAAHAEVERLRVADPGDPAPGALIQAASTAARVGAGFGRSHVLARHAPEAAAVLAQAEKANESRAALANLEAARTRYGFAYEGWEKRKAAAEREAHAQAIAEKQRTLDHAQREARKYPTAENVERVAMLADEIATLTNDAP